MKDTPHKKWTKADIEHLRKLIVVDGFSFALAAAHFGVTKNSIIGACNRHGIEHGANYVQVNKPSKKKPNPPSFKPSNFETRLCVLCEQPFSVLTWASTKFCCTKHANDYHNHKKSLDREIIPRSVRKEFLNPPEKSKKCLCGCVAVPNHKVCYQHAWVLNEHV